MTLTCARLANTISFMKTKLFLLISLVSLGLFQMAHAAEVPNMDVVDGIKKVEKDDDDDDDNEELGERRSLSSPQQIAARKARIEKQRAAKREATRKRLARQRKNNNWRKRNNK